MEQLKGLLSHVDPHLTLGQLVERVVREAVERHDPARPPRGRRTGSRATAGGADETSVPKEPTGPSAEAAQRNAMPAGVTTSAAKARASSPKDADCEHAPATAAKRPGATTRPSAPKDATGPGGATAEPAGRKAAPAGGALSPAKASADCRRAVPAKRPEAAAVRSATSAPKAEYARQAAPAAAPQFRGRGRTIPVAVKRQVWERDRGGCSYVDRGSGRRCGSPHLLQIDHILPYALGGSAEPDNLRLLCRARQSLGKGDDAM